MTLSRAAVARPIRADRLILRWDEPLNAMLCYLQPLFTGARTRPVP